MSNLRLGACLPNIDEPDDASFNRLRSMRAEQIGTLWTRADRNGVGGTQHRRPVYERLERELNKPTYDLRVGPSTACSINTWLDMARAALDQIPDAIIVEGRLNLRVLNEVNLKSEGGWIPLTYFALIEGVYRLRSMLRECPIVCAPISLGDPDWLEWLTEFDALCAKDGHPFDRRAVNAYAHLLNEVYRFVGARPVDVTEMNTLEIAPSRTRGRWIIDRASMLASLGVESAQVFIAGGTSHGAWPDQYILADDEAETIGNRGPLGITPAAPKPVEVTPMPQNPPREDVIARIHNRAEEYGFPIVDIAVKLFIQESGLRQYDDKGEILTSPAGAKGIGQFMPEWWGEHIWSTWETSIDTAMRWITDLYHNDYRSIPLVLVHYNGGGGAVAAWRSGHPYDESVAYVTAILGDTTVAQFSDLASLGYSFEIARNVCSCIALHGAARMLGIPLDVSAVIDRMWANRSLWTGNDDFAGSNAFLATLEWFGMSGSVIDAERAKQALWNGHPVALSTPRHYYLAQRPARTDNDLFVGNTGLARTNGLEWMSADTIRARDEGLEMIEITHTDAVVMDPPVETPDEITKCLDGLWTETLDLVQIDHEQRARQIQELIARLKVAIGR